MVHRYPVPLAKIEGLWSKSTIKCFQVILRKRQGNQSYVDSFETRLKRIETSAFKNIQIMIEHFKIFSIQIMVKLLARLQARLLATATQPSKQDNIQG